MALLVPTDRDPARPAALAPTTPPGVLREPAAPPGPARLPDGCELVAWLAVDGAGEMEHVALVRHSRLWPGKVWAKDRIVKLYRPGLGPVDGVHPAWRGIGEDHHVVVLHKAGVVDGRVFEIMDDAGDPLDGQADPGAARRRTLRDVIAEHPTGLPEDVVVHIVGQLGMALAALGAAGLAHLDLRPDNVLVGARPDESGPEVSVIDLGLAHVLDASRPWDVARPFSAYHAPELLLAKMVTAATDWWSLGLVAAELAAGGHSLLGQDERNVRLQLTKRNLDHPEGLSARVRELVDGLLVVDADDRWQAAEVARWAEGTRQAPPRQAPPPPPSSPPQAPPPAVRAFGFADEEFTHVPALMDALQEHWDTAAAALFGPAPNRWAEFAAWLRQFDDRPGFAPGEVVKHVERLGVAPQAWSPHARLLMLLRRADPGLVPGYRGLPADRTRMRQTRVWDDPRFPGMAADFWRWRLFAELDGAAGAHDLAALDDLWRRLDDRCQAVTAALWDGSNPYHAPLASVSAASWRQDLLQVAIDETFRGELRRGLVSLRAEITTALGGPQPEFEQLAAAMLPASPRRRSGEPDVNELVGLLMLHRVAGGVREGLDDVRAKERARAAEDAVRSLEWRRRERWRDLDRPVAMGWAAAAMGILFVVAATVLVAGDAVPQRLLSIATDEAFGRAWGFVAVGLAAQTACEVWLAATIGAPYHRDYSLSTILLRAVGRVGRREQTTLIRSAVVLAAVLAAAAALLTVLLVAPYAVTVPVLAVHVRSALRRHRRWQTDHDELRALAGVAPNLPERHRP